MSSHRRSASSSSRRRSASSSSKHKKAGLTILRSLRKNTSRLRKLNIKPKERINIFDKVIKEIPKAVKKRSMKQELQNYRKREERSNLMKDIVKKTNERNNVVSKRKRIKINQDNDVIVVRQRKSDKRKKSSSDSNIVSKRSNVVFKESKRPEIQRDKDIVVRRKSDKRKRSSSDSLISNMKRLNINDDEEDDKVNKPLKKRRKFRDGKF